MAIGVSKTDANSLFTKSWQSALAPVPEMAMLATVTIFDPESADATWVPGTGLVTDPAAAWYESGPARIQPIRNTQYVQGDRLQAVRVSIPIEGPFTGEPGVGFVMDVEDGGDLDPGNEVLSYICIETMDSSNPFERTLVFEVNYKNSLGE